MMRAMLCSKYFLKIVKCGGDTCVNSAYVLKAAYPKGTAGMNSLCLCVQINTVLYFLVFLVLLFLVFIIIKMYYINFNIASDT